MVVRINGVIVSGNVSGSIVVNGNQVLSGGKVLYTSECETIELEVSGNLLSVESDGSVTVRGNVHGDVSAEGSVNCRDVGGSVDAGGSVNCVSINGSVRAGGSVSAGRIG